MLRCLQVKHIFFSIKLVTEKITDFIITSKRQLLETNQPDQRHSPVLAPFSFLPS
jgi:hypothetical protein